MSEERFNLSRRKALAALGTIGVASAGAGLGTSAYFSDQETFENNQLTAGTLDLGVGYSTHYSNWSDDEGNGVSVRMYDGAAGETGSASDLQPGETGMPTNDAWLIAVDDPDQFLTNTQTGTTEGNGSCSNLTQADGESALVSLGDVKPGDFGEVTFDLELCTNPGYVWINNPGGYTANENTVTEPEGDDPQEDGTADSTDPANVELLDVVQAAVWLDSDGGDAGDDGNNYQNGSEYPVLSGSLGEVLDALNSGNGVRIDGVSKEKLTTSSTVTPKDWTRAGVNRLSPGDETYDADVELVDAPGTSPPQSQVAHLTSGGTATNDYVTTGVTVDGSPTLAELGSGSLQYDYYAGTANGGSAPDEVFLLLEEADGTQTVVGHSDDGPGESGWQTRDVSMEFSQSGWFTFETNSDGVIADSDADPEHYDILNGTLNDNFDTSATSVLGMAAARGSTSSGGVIIDMYVANPRATVGGTETDLGNFPTSCFRGETDFSAAFAWWVPVDHGNEIQSDSVEFDLGFYTEQCRHNDGSGMNNAAVDDS